jgi:hypothetical protein
MMKLISCILCMALIVSCTYKKEAIQPTCIISSTVSFSTEVNTVITNNCLSCHNNGFTSGGISLQGYAKVQAQALNGKLFGSINHSGGFSKMPQGRPKLDDCTIATIKKWIDNGAPNN